MTNRKLTPAITKRIAMYKTNPEFWDEEIKKQKGERYVEIVREFINSTKTLKEVGVDFDIQQERVRQILWQAMSVVAQKKEDNGVKRVLGKGPLADSLQIEEYDHIKELLFRGEGIMDITAISGRSYPTVNRVRKSESFEDYFNVNRKIKTPKPIPPAPVAPEITPNNVDSIMVTLAITKEEIKDRILTLLAERALKSI